MQKDNQFKSSSFFMAAGDILKILIIDESGNPFTLDLVGEGAEVVTTVPDAPTVAEATDITSTSFTANWYFNESTSGYYLDVATDSAFTSMVAGYNNLNVSNVNNYSVVGLLNNYVYYYRVRAYNEVGTSANSATQLTTTAIGAADDWFSPSKDELNKVYVNCISGTDENGVTFTRLTSIPSGQYWSSTENSHSWAWTQYLTSAGAVYDGDQTFEFKSNNSYRYGAMRTFTTAIVYALRDNAPCGGNICYIVDNGDGTYTYYEFYAASTTGAFSNVTVTAVTGVSAAIGQGQANTTKIIAQLGHTASAASYCNDLDL